MDEMIAYEIIQKYPEVDNKGCFYIIPDNYTETEELKTALDYMFYEWDYAVYTISDYKDKYKGTISSAVL
jgi:hypothetical protein